MKKNLLFIIMLLSIYQVSPAQTRIHGRVVSAVDQRPLPGAMIWYKDSQVGVSADSSGRFTIPVEKAGILVISFLGFISEELKVTPEQKSGLLIEMHPAHNTLSEVVISTGYQELPQERSTGSFTHVSNELFNRSTSTNILTRLESVASGMEFNRRMLTSPDGEPEIRVRGVASIRAERAPLIVVDDFPYEGRIEHIDPDDVEDITILKDAAAASIWGASAGNGVIVIKTKKGRFNQKARLSFNSSVSTSSRPDLYYNPAFLGSADFIELEKTLFERNYFAADEKSTLRPPLTPVVELLIAKRDGLLPAAEAESRIESFKGLDVRRDFTEYFYRPELKRQVSANLSGGAEFFKYYLSAGVDKEASYLVGNGFQKLSLSSQNTIKPHKKLEVNLGVNYAGSITILNGIPMQEVRSSYGKAIFPYARLADENGQPLVVTKDYRDSYVNQAVNQGLLDWQYRPLEELGLNDNSRRRSELRVNSGVRYQIFKDLNFDLKYQYEEAGDHTWYHLSPLSYLTRDLLNRYTQPDGSNPIPYGGYVNSSTEIGSYHSGRAQVNYYNNWGDHTVSFLGGAEIRDAVRSRESNRIYGYDEEISSAQLTVDYATRYQTRPFGISNVPTAVLPVKSYLDRYISYYGNGSYEFQQKYTVSGSVRKDASNLFGVNANQKWVPLWSTGLAWNISREKFYGVKWLPDLKLRASFGYTGNIDKDQTAFTVVRFNTDAFTGLPIGTIESAGNPDLRWERVAISNVGLDFSSNNRRVSGTLDMFRKKGMDLFSRRPLDPTTGYLKFNMLNYADMVTRGIDLTINTINLAKPFRWETSLLLSHVADEVTNVHDAVPSASSFFSIFTEPIVGKSLYRIYSYPTPALDPATGDPLVMHNGKLSKDYSNYYRDIPYTSLIDHGPQFPTFTGAVKNNLSWNGLTISANVSWKAGYFFRRSSIVYDQLYRNRKGHRDYALRWQKPGDELITTVPSMPLVPNGSRDLVYTNSAALVEKGDHIRFQDLQLSYRPRFRIGGLPAESIRLNVYATNLGILWRANRQGLDPDYPTAFFLAPRTISLGLNVNL